MPAPSSPGVHFILVMLVSGMVIPVSKLPGAMRTVSEALPTCWTAR